MVKNWARRTPEDFRFTAKFPKVITHDKKFKNVEKELSLFYDAMKPLKDKSTCVVNTIPTLCKNYRRIGSIKTI